MTDTRTQNGMAAEAYIARLGARGIEYVFANAGTDFAPIVEALSQTRDAKVPRFMTVPHENVAMAMAHGYYRVSGKPAAVMVHVTVGTANAINGGLAQGASPAEMLASLQQLAQSGQVPLHDVRMTAEEVQSSTTLDAQQKQHILQALQNMGTIVAQNRGGEDMAWLDTINIPGLNDGGGVGHA